MWKPMLTAVLLLGVACGNSEKEDPLADGAERGGAASGSAEPQTASAQAQPLNEIFRLHKEFGGCGITREQKTEDLSGFGFQKSDLSAIFGTQQVSVRDSAGQSRDVSLSLSWTDSSALAVETFKLPSDDDFEPTCPGKTVALPAQLSFSSIEVGSVSAKGYLFTTSSSKASGTFQARSAAGKDLVLTINVIAGGSSTGTVSEVSETQPTGGSSRQTKIVLEW